MDLNQFKDWAAANPSRSIKIEMQSDRQKQNLEIKVFAYDSQLLTGKYVTSADEIDLETKAMEDARRDIARAEETIARAEAAKQKAFDLMQRIGGEQQHGLSTDETAHRDNG